MNKFRNINASNFNQIQVGVSGDGASNTLKLNLSKPPFNIDYQGKLPSSFQIDSFDETLTASASISLSVNQDAILLVTFSDVVPNTDEIFTVTINSIYEGDA